MKGCKKLMNEIGELINDINEMGSIEKMSDAEFDEVFIRAHKVIQLCMVISTSVAQEFQRRYGIVFDGVAESAFEFNMSDRDLWGELLQKIDEHDFDAQIDRFIKAAHRPVGSHPGKTAPGVLCQKLQIRRKLGKLLKLR